MKKFFEAFLTYSLILLVNFTVFYITRNYDERAAILNGYGHYDKNLVFSWKNQTEVVQDFIDNLNSAALHEKQQKQQEENKRLDKIW